MVVNDRQFLTDEVTVSEFPTIPSGTYDATFEGVTGEDHDQYGDRWVWHWTIPEMHPDGGAYELQVWTPPASAPRARRWGRRRRSAPP